MRFVQTRKQIILFCPILIFLFLISPACACPTDSHYISIIPIPVVYGMAGILAITALMYKKHRVLTVFLLIVCYVALILASAEYEFWALYYTDIKILAMLPFLILLNLVYLSFDDKEDRSRRIIAIAVVIAVVLGIAFNMYIAGTSWFLVRHGGLTACQWDLRNIGTALEMYTTDNNGKYPDSLDALAPDYVKRLPRCSEDRVSEKTREYIKKMYGKTIDDYKYTVSADHKRYTMWCSGTNHSDIRGYPGYPQYNSEQGVIVGR